MTQLADHLGHLIGIGPKALMSLQSRPTEPTGHMVSRAREALNGRVI